VRWFRIDQLIEDYTRLLDHERRMQGFELEMQNQIEAVLGKIQEAVFSIDSNNIIIHANQSACTTFNEGRPIRGKRMEELIRNPEFLDSVHHAKRGMSRFNREIPMRIAGKSLWFEVSATPIPKSAAHPYGSIIFVFHDITRLKELETVKNNFVANVSHELKTPITIIKGFTETLLDEGAGMDEETRTKFLQKIEANSERLHLIVQDLLTLSRIESEPSFLQKTPTPLGPLLEGIADTALSLVRPQQHFLLDNQAGDLVVPMDGFKISQVIQNLIDNAIRYADVDSHIELRVSTRTEPQAQLVCEVLDDGKGIPEADLPNIFRRFYRVDKARSRLRGGTGLGLSIARGIIHLHGGEISAHNRKSGGLCVAFHLPLGDPNAPKP
jgi:PAS domain S-box-containing protein